ncbi:MAG: hypothetical protein AAGF58_08195 [Pseudomonadota bacterium]
MSLSHTEFKDLRNEIENAIVDKASKAVLNSALKWIGMIALVGGAGGYAIINSAFQKQLGELARENRLEIDQLARELNDQLRQARYEIMRVEHVREEMERSTASVEMLNEATEDLAVRANRAKEISDDVTADFRLELPIVLFTRDHVIGQVAQIEREVLERTGASAQEGRYPLKSVNPPADDWLVGEGIAWGERKVIILRERPAAEVEDTAPFQEMQLRGLSATLRIGLARNGYEVEEWVTKPGAPESDIAELFSDGGASASYSIDQPAILAHEEFGGRLETVTDLQNYLQNEEGLETVQAVATPSFAPDPGFRYSFSDLQAEAPKFEIGEVAVLYLPLDLVQE